MEKSAKSIEVISSDASINIALDTIKIGKQALIFVNTKRGAEKTAEEMSKKIKATNKELEKEWNEISEKALHSLSTPTQQCKRLANCLNKGIAFHHSGLTSQQREIIEDNFRNGRIKIISATPTIAQGVDLPAFRAIIKDLKRYSGRRGMAWIPVLEYLQQAGRAGRPSYDKFGEAICLATTQGEKNVITERYIEGEPEDIISKLSAEPALRTYILSLIASNLVTTKQELFDFFSKTFYAHQYKDNKELQAKIEKMLLLLDEFGFVKRAKEDFIAADELNYKKEKIKTTLIGKRVAELYLDPVTAYHIICCLRKAANIEPTAFSFLQMISNTLEMRPLLSIRTKEWDDIQERIAKEEGYLLESEPNLYEMEYNTFLESIKTAMFFEEWVNEKNEEYLLEKYNIRPGEINAKLEIAYWLCYSAEELARLLGLMKLIKDLAKLQLRLRYGVKEELFPLLKLKQIGRVRARLLFNNGIKDISDVKKADLSTLSYLLGKQIALHVKKQVGEDFENIKVKEGKRKGQINLNDYSE